jgi:hypothetical protein
MEGAGALHQHPAVQVVGGPGHCPHHGPQPQLLLVLLLLLLLAVVLPCDRAVGLAL